MQFDKCKILQVHEVKALFFVLRDSSDEMQIIGDNYVKDEFRRHKTANTEQTIAFMEGWAVS